MIEYLVWAWCTITWLSSLCGTVASNYQIFHFIQCMISNFSPILNDQCYKGILHSLVFKICSQSCLFLLLPQIIQWFDKKNPQSTIADYGFESHMERLYTNDDTMQFWNNDFHFFSQTHIKQLLRQLFLEQPHAISIHDVTSRQLEWVCPETIFPFFWDLENSLSWST